MGKKILIKSTINMSISCLFPRQLMFQFLYSSLLHFLLKSFYNVNSSSKIYLLKLFCLWYVSKFLGLCTSIHPEGYQDCEIMLLILMLFKMSLEKHLKQIPLVDFQSLLINLMKNIRDWNTKVTLLKILILFFV